MARIARVVIPHFPHHVTQRGNRRQQTFFCDDDYREYIDLLVRAIDKASVEIWAYCLMPNHVHFAIVPEHQNSLSALFSDAHRRYTRMVNFREGWRGHLWQERFHSTAMDEQHLLATVRYIELNPVRAGLCDRPENWPWSSVHAHLGGKDDELVKVRPMLDRVGDWESYLAVEQKEEEINVIRQYTKTGRPLGDDEFIGELERLTKRCLRKNKPGRKSRNK